MAPDDRSYLIGQRSPVLDHGYVELVGFMGSDEEVIASARMSTDGAFKSWEPYEGHPRGDLGLLEYLYRHKHMTPFECGGEMVVEVQAPIMVVREWQRHRTQSYNEMSGRYAQMPNLHYVPAPDRVLSQSQANRQGGSGALMGSVVEEFRIGVHREQQDVYVHYEQSLEEGIAKETARLNTPVSRYTRFRAKTDLRNWLAFLLLRMHPTAQWEIRQYAFAVADLVQSLWPRTFALFQEYDLGAVHLSRTDAARLQRILAGDLNLTREDIEHFGKILNNRIDPDALRRA